MLHTSHFVPGRTVVLGDLRLDDDLRAELIRNDEIRGLVEAPDTLGTLRLAMTDARAGQHPLDRCFQHVADQLAH